MNNKTLAVLNLLALVLMYVGFVPYVGNHLISEHAQEPPQSIVSIGGS